MVIRISERQKVREASRAVRRSNISSEVILDTEILYSYRIEKLIALLSRQKYKKCRPVAKRSFYGRISSLLTMLSDFNPFKDFLKLFQAPGSRKRHVRSSERLVLLTGNI